MSATLFGLKNVVTPHGLAALLIFGWGLILYRKHLTLSVVCGILFIYGIYHVQANLVFGSLDVLFVNPTSRVLITFLSAGLGALFFWWGLRFYSEWSRTREGETVPEIILWIPGILKPQSRSFFWNLVFWGASLFLFMTIAQLLTILGAAWTKDYEMFVHVMNLVEENPELADKAVTQYALASIYPFVGLWVIVTIFQNIASLGSRLSAIRGPIMSLVLSSVCFAVSLGIFWGFV